MDLFLAKKLVAAIVLPPTGLLLATMVGLLIAVRRPRAGLLLAWLSVLGLFALSLPSVAHALLQAVDRTPVLDVDRARKAQAIVILGGGIRRAAAEYGGDTLGRLTLERVRYGALVARKTQLPVLVSGGAVHGGTAEAVLMQRALEDEFGVPVRWVEAQSRDTRTNAVMTASLLRAEGVSRIVLVAHSFDMPRASAEFVHAGMEVTGAPTAVAGTAPLFDHPLALMPSMAALQTSYYVLYEWLADIARRVRLAF